MSNVARCELCGEPMPPGEEVFKFHGYSGECPKPPLPRPAKPSPEDTIDRLERRCAALEAGLRDAVENIKAWHNMGGSQDVWDIYYEHAPEMKRIRALLENKHGS